MYAILEEGKAVKWGSLSEIFPDVSFAAAGPDKDWLKENGVVDVSMTLPYNADEDAWSRIKNKRNNLLVSTDWTQLADTLTPELTKKYAEYRSALRNVTSAKSPSDVVWPEDPAKGA